MPSAVEAAIGATPDFSLPDPQTAADVFEPQSAYHPARIAISLPLDAIRRDVGVWLDVLADDIVCGVYIVAINLASPQDRIVPLWIAQQLSAPLQGPCDYTRMEYSPMCCSFTRIWC